MAFRLGNTGRNGAASGLGIEMDAGLIQIYTGTQPALVGDAPTGSILGTCTFGNPAFGSPVSGLITADTITPDTTADDTGLAGMFRIRDSGDTLTIADGTAGQGGEDLVFDNASIIAGGTISITGFTITVPI